MVRVVPQERGREPPLRLGRCGLPEFPRPPASQRLAPKIRALFRLVPALYSASGPRAPRLAADVRAHLWLW